MINIKLSSLFYSFLQTMMADFNTVADDFMSDLLNSADGQTELSMLDHFNVVALNFLGKVCLVHIRIYLKLDLYDKNNLQIN